MNLKCLLLSTSLLIFGLQADEAIGSTVELNSDVGDAQPLLARIDAELEKRALEMVNELSNRRRLHYLYSNPQTPDKGVQKSYVNVGKGNLTFVQRDLVRIDGIPIVAGRVYDSTIVDSEDFGPGWKFSMEERLVRDRENLFTFVDANNNRHSLQRKGRKLVSDGSGQLGLLSGTISANQIEVRDDRFIRTFVRDQDRFLLSRIRDRNGNVLTFKYRDGLLTAVETSNGRTLRIERNHLNRISAIADDVGRRIEYKYTPAGTLRSSSLLTGEIVLYGYDRRRMLAEIIDARGVRALISEFDDKKRVREISVLGNSFTFQYERNRTLITDGRGVVSSFLQNGQGFTIGATDNEGMVTRIASDEFRLQPKSLSVNDVDLARFYYNSSGELEQATYTGSDSTYDLRFEYYPTRQLKAVYSDGIERQSYSYDDKGRLINAKSASGSEYVIDWDDNGQPGQVQIDDLIIDISSDPFGRTTRFARGDDQEILIQYDDHDRVKAIDTMNMGSSTYTYGSDKFRATATYDHDHFVEYKYDAAGNIRAFNYEGSDGKSGSDIYVVGDNNELRKIISSDNPDFAFEYDELGRATKVTSASRELLFEYDEQSRVRKATVDDRVALEADYALMQLDLAHNVDSRTFRTQTRQHPGSGVYGSVSEIVYTRPVYTPYQAVAFDSEMNRFVLREESDWFPEHILFDGFARRNLPISEAGFQGKITGFDKPSNALFVPPEYASVNCCVCNSAIYSHDLSLYNFASSTIELGEVAVFESAAIGTCEYDYGPPPPFFHSVEFDDGNSASAFAYPPSYYTGHTYAEAGIYNASASMQCMCGTFGLSWAFMQLFVSAPNSCTAVQTPPETTSGTLAERMGQLITRIQAGSATFTAINLTITAGQIAQGTASNTVQWGLNDIERYNQIGLHVVNPTGSVLPWQDMQVDWCKYGAPGLSNEAVLTNFINDGNSE